MGHAHDDERIDHAELAARAGLVYVADEAPGIQLQATGRDDRGRKQYRYHERWNEVRDLAKFERLHEFGRTLPRIRAAVDEALGESDLGRRKVLAAVLALLDATAIRVGNDSYARENGTFGLTTIRRRHVEIEGSHIVFRFEGKGSKTIEVSLENDRLARVGEACRDLPGYEVFKWIDDEGKRHDVRSDDVNEFIRDLTGSDFTAKNFRTWLGTLEAFRCLRAAEGPADEDGVIACRLAAVDAAASRLQNTREVARDVYVHPIVLDRFPWSDADDPSAVALSRKGKPKHLTRDEWALLVLLDES